MDLDYFIFLFGGGGQKLEGSFVGGSGSRVLMIRILVYLLQKLLGRLSNLWPLSGALLKS